MRLSHNLLAGLANSGWSAVIALLVIPFYLKYLGIEAYGLIGFFMTTQAVFSLLDMGMTPTISREVARCSAEGQINKSGVLLHSLAVIYWSIAGVICLLIFILAPFIAEYWLQSKQLPSTTILHSVMLMGLVVACRWPVGLYQGVLIGAQRLTISSGINMIMVTIGSMGAVLILEFVSPTIEAFFIWQACVGIVYAFIIRLAAWRAVGKFHTYRFGVENIRRVLKFSLGVGAISLSGLALTQIDKIILSKTIDLEFYGQYMLATMAASTLYILIVPVFNIIYPRFSVLVAQGRQDVLLVQYRTASHLMSTMLFPAAMIVVMLSHDLIQLWTGSAVLASDVAPIVSILLIAFALHGVMYLPYSLMLAHGETKAMAKIYIFLIIFIVPLTFILSINYGALGGALAQFFLFLVYVLVGNIIAHNKFFNRYAKTWLMKDIGVPFSISLFIGTLGYFAMNSLGEAVYLKIAFGLILWFFAAALSIMSSKLSRPYITRYWRQVFL